MLSRLTIDNYALIDHLEIAFQDGFTVITGETGAGKSILLGAISMILGQRADGSVLLDKSRKCVVEGVFQTKGYNLEDFFSANQLDHDKETILRREINQSGKSRSFINDTPVNFALLKSLGDRLVNIHSQHSIVTLTDANFQLAVLDSYAGNEKNIESYRKEYLQYLSLRSELNELIQREARTRTEKDYYNFLFQELEGAELTEGEQIAAEQRLEVLSHAEDIKVHLGKIRDLLSDGENSTLHQLSEIQASLSSIERFQNVFNDFRQRINSNYIDLKDISREVESVNETIQFDPEEIQLLSKRLDLIYTLEKKHNAATLNELLSKKEELSQKLLDENSISDRIESLRNETEIIRSELLNKAEKLSGKRKGVCQELENKLCEMLRTLGIPDAQIRLEVMPHEELTEDGMDSVRFLFSANRGVEMNEIAKIASGGELSRLMLSIKSMISRKNLLPTIIFDEIDNGVSGAIAGKVASILKKMGTQMQVIAITHLPQIAGQGEHHFWVYKTREKNTTRTRMKKLDKQERVNEIAKMLSNKDITTSAIQTAEELLQH
jgi:DNA repair protein RecN (Recombination protein N)